MRVVLYVASFFVATIGISLYLFSTETETMFSWTIAVPLTAAFLGAGYWATFPLEFLSARSRSWATARVAVPAVWLFTTLTLVVTIVHRDKFHFDADDWNTIGGTWIWVGVYVSVPVALGAAWIAQLRVGGEDPPRVAPLSRLAQWALGGPAALLVPVGALLLVAPVWASSAWPWELTPLTGRAVGAWLLSVGVLLISAVRAGDWTWLEPVLAMTLSFGILHLVAIGRYGGDVDWSHPTAYVWGAVLVELLVLGAVGLRTARAAKTR
ncbi:MAG TPA: hypothetical protein VM184_05045 [Gaiellaceae bacterium]|nr:hypothetical protein [Gaiellaceae bacterium]